MPRVVVVHLVGIEKLLWKNDKIQKFRNKQNVSPVMGTRISRVTLPPRARQYAFECIRIRVAATHSRFYEMVIRVGRSLNGWRVRFDVKITNHRAVGLRPGIYSNIICLRFYQLTFPTRYTCRRITRPNKMFDFDVQWSTVTNNCVSLSRWPTTLLAHSNYSSRARCPQRLFPNRHHLVNPFYSRTYYFSFCLSKHPGARWKTTFIRHVANRGTINGFR